MLFFWQAKKHLEFPNVSSKHFLERRCELSVWQQPAVMVEQQLVRFDCVTKILCNKDMHIKDTFR